MELMRSTSEDINGNGRGKVHVKMENNRKVRKYRNFKTTKIVRVMTNFLNAITATYLRLQ